MNLFQRMVLGVWGAASLLAAFEWVEESNRWKGRTGDVLAVWVGVTIALAVCWILGSKKAPPPKG